MDGLPGDRVVRVLRENGYRTRLTAKTTKTVLACFKDHKRCVTLGGGQDELKEVYHVFQDVLSASTIFFLQLKDHEWEGVYIDLLKQDVPDRSWIRVCVSEAEPIAVITVTAKSSDQVAKKLHI